MPDLLTSPTEMPCFEKTHPTVPKMASVFINELLARQIDSGRNLQGWIQSTQRSRTVHVLFDPHTTVRHPEHAEAHEKPGQYMLSKKAPCRKADPGISVRMLVKEISHHFNNLLMGIWGNISLMRMNMDHHHPANQRLNEMETLIQDGAYLTHMIIGYLGERRVFAQRVRLRQLSREIHVLLEKKKPLGELISRLEWATLPKQVNLVTGITGIIFQQFLEGIRTVCRELNTMSCPDKTFARKLKCVNKLIERGLTLTFQMRCSTGDIRNPKRRWINLGILTKQLVNNAVENYPDVSVIQSTSRAIPLVLADRTLLMQAVVQILDNAFRFVPTEGGQVEISINMLQDESPQERYGVRSIGNCLVLTIKDNGKGIPIEAQPHIFEPFYSYSHNFSSVGLGLAAAKGIIRSHGGHIGVQSAEHTGSVFKTYLPFYQK
jgi:signal transduction histidine kinase